MKRLLLALPLALLTVACSQRGPAVPRPYAASEEGLTLIYINPSLPADQQAAQRLQVRVDKVSTREDGATVVLKSFTLGLQRPFQATFALKGGGVGLVGPDGRSETVVLPPGFPEGAVAWNRPGVRYRVLGRGAWLQGAQVLPSDRVSEGIWVEAASERSPATRTLYVEGLGEVETDERQPDGRWATVNLLSQYGFTDLPPAPLAEPAAGSKAAPKALAKSAAKRLAKARAAAPPSEP